jgi:hypothetical protein
MKIDRRLNLVLPIVDANGSPVAYIHSTPIDRQAFEANFMLISRTFATIYTQGLGIVAGPRVAALVLKDVATSMGIWEGPAGAANSLMSEIRRLTSIATPGSNGWEVLPYSTAISRGLIDPDDAAEAENALVFFTVASSMHRKSESAAVLDGALRLWGAWTSSSNITELIDSFRASTPVATSAEKPKPSSLPL